MWRQKNAMNFSQMTTIYFKMYVNRNSRHCLLLKKTVEKNDSLCSLVQDGIKIAF